MTDAIITSTDKDYSTAVSEKIQKIVQQGVIMDFSPFMEVFLVDNRTKKALNDFIGKVLEYWQVTFWLAEKLKAHGELVVIDLCGICVWGRQKTENNIETDNVIEKIARESLA